MKRKSILKSTIRIISFVFCICIFFQMGFSETMDYEVFQKETDLIYNTIRIFGMAGTGTVFPRSFESLLYNPASLPKKTRLNEETLYLGASVDSYFRPEYIVPIITGISSSDNFASTLLINTKELITSSGVGAAGAFGFGFIPKRLNIGVGVYGGASVFLNGKPFPLGTEGYIKMSLNFPVGYGWTILKNETQEISLGANVHPEIAIIKGLNGSDVDALAGGTTTVSSLVSDAVDNPYFSVPLDLGLIYSFLNKPYDNAEIRLAITTKNLFGNYFGPGNDILQLEKRKFVNMGTGVYLPFEIFTVKCFGIFTGELYGVNQMIEGTSDFWKALRLGAELNIGNVIFLRGGLCSGYPCLGAEIKFLSVGVGFSWQTVEKGLYVGDNPLSVLRLSVQIY